MSLQSGQRVEHERFGTGVTTLCTSDRTTIAFDEHGVKTFVTSMLEVKVLSAADTWMTDARGKPRAKTAPKAGTPPRT